MATDGQLFTLPTPYVSSEDTATSDDIRNEEEKKDTKMKNMTFMLINAIIEKGEGLLATYPE